MNLPILLVEDDADARELLAQMLTGLGHRVVEASGFEEAERALTGETFGSVFSDLNLGPRSGLDVCISATRTQPGLPVILVTGHGNLHVAIEAMRAGAYDFIEKPIDMQLLALSVRRAMDHRRVQVQLNELQHRLDEGPPSKLLGQSDSMRRVHEMIARVAETPSSVLVTGESGTGKELVARALHDQSDRKSARFVAINCASVSSTLLESELFGHKKGAFTDARADRAGLFEQANGGTLFLDEVGEMAPEMQAKLLRALEERRIRAVGADRDVPVDVRLVAATHRDLEHEIEEGRFREDLYYRLNVMQIHLPPLRARGGDTLLLAKEFIRKKATQLGREVDGLTQEAAALLLNYDWPGNVRQLLNCIERAVALARFDKITPEDLPEKVRRYAASNSDAPTPADPTNVQPLSVIERRYIEQVLRVTNNNKSQAARLLGVDRRTLYRKLESYEMDSRRIAVAN